MATRRIDLGDIPIEVVQKDIKNIHLSVYPPIGKVRIAAPLRMKLDTIRVFAISKLRWIKQQQEKLRSQQRETPREYLDRESHYVWGRRYLLKVVEADQPPTIELRHSRMVLRVRPGTSVGTHLKTHILTKRRPRPAGGGAKSVAGLAELGF
jgi:predicted metal-dependent hydrolase